jgi:hypothetical protein
MVVFILFYKFNGSPGFARRLRLPCRDVARHVSTLTPDIIIKIAAANS